MEILFTLLGVIGIATLPVFLSCIYHLFVARLEREIRASGEPSTAERATIKVISEVTRNRREAVEAKLTLEAAIVASAILSMRKQAVREYRAQISHYRVLGITDEFDAEVTRTFSVIDVTVTVWFSMNYFSRRLGIEPGNADEIVDCFPITEVSISGKDLALLKRIKSTLADNKSEVYELHVIIVNPFYHPEFETV